MVRALIAKLIRMGGSRSERFKEKNFKAGKLDAEEKKLDKLETRLENITDKMIKETEELEGIKRTLGKRKTEFSFFSGEFTVLAIQDVVGAAFGALFFTITQEIWEIAAKLALPNLIAISAISFLMGFSLIFFSRRRKLVSMRIFHSSAIRALEIYLISFFTSLILIMVFNTAPDFLMAIKQTVVVTFPAVITAPTADFLFFLIFFT